MSDVQTLAVVFGTSPTSRIREMEWSVRNLSAGAGAAAQFLRDEGVSTDAFQAALNVKKSVGQINVVIHALGILLALPHVLDPDERVEFLALGAGNTGRAFDLQTDRRVAEFKFITWRGGAEAIRQNGVFKDFLKLLWDTSDKRKELYLTGTKEALAFMSGRRALTSVLSRDVKLKAGFEARYGYKYARVGDFYRDHGELVKIVDLFGAVPGLRGMDLSAADESLEI
jgi:hypothetical protein